MNKSISFKDASGKKHTVTARISEGRLSICDARHGQTVDEIKPKNQEQRDFIGVWSTYHLNDMHAGTPRQEGLLAQNKYGTAWLTRILPENLERDLSALMDAITNIENLERAKERALQDTPRTLKKIGNEPRLLAFGLYEGLTVEECDSVTIDGTSLEYAGDGYLVCTDEEAHGLIAEYIKESVWAFRPSFLAKQTGIGKEVFELLSGKCEGANEAILSMIHDFDGFVQAAIDADGRGHFLNSYDGTEAKQNVQGVTYYIYNQ